MSKSNARTIAPASFASEASLSISISRYRRGFKDARRIWIKGFGMMASKAAVLRALLPRAFSDLQPSSRLNALKTGVCMIAGSLLQNRDNFSNHTAYRTLTSRIATICCGDKDAVPILQEAQLG